MLIGILGTRYFYDGAMQAKFLAFSFLILFSFGFVNHTSIRALVLPAKFAHTVSSGLGSLT